MGECHIVQTVKTFCQTSRDGVIGWADRGQRWACRGTRVGL